jgi:type III secretion protein C
MNEIHLHLTLFNTFSCKKMRLSLIVLISSLLTFTSTTTYAKAIPLSTTDSVSYHLIEEPLSQFLKHFFTENRITSVLSEKVQQDVRTLNGTRHGSPKEIYESILRTNALTSYFDGNTVFIYKTDEITHQFYSIDPDSIQRLQHSITLTQLSDDNNSVRIDKKAGLAEVIGVPKYAEKFRQLMQTVIQKKEDTIFRYYRLKYAWASDRTFTAGNNPITIPGVANILKEVIHGHSMAPQPFPRINPIDRAVFPSSNTQNMTPSTASPSTTLKYNPVQNHHDTAQHRHPTPRQTPAVSKQYASIVADPQHNAIIIRDRPDRIPLYEDLLKTLDIPTKVIGIEATIIDVNIDKLKESGIEWRYAKNNHESLFANPGTKANFLNSLSDGSVNAIHQIPGFQLGAIIGDRQRFIARVNLLASEGTLQISSKPTVATLNDLEAVIESSRSMYIKVPGAYDASLFKVLAGTILKVTPHVIDTGDNTKIRLIVSVEDGSINMTQGTEIPISTKNAVSTQAIINAEHSLLLGGLVHEQTISKQHKIPLLGDIPFLGKLFKSESSTNIHTERLFLITPTLLSFDGSTQKARE